MRYLRIFLLHFERVFEGRMRSFVWFLSSLLNPLILILFWKGATANKNVFTDGWTFSLIASYYLLLVVGGSLLTSHIEEEVSRFDIKEGNLISYLLRPFSYFWMKFLSEIPYRILQGFFGIIVLVILFPFFNKTLTITHSPLILLLSIFMAILAYFLSFTFKMIIGILGFWLIEARGLFETIEIVMFIFGGGLLPLALLPLWLANIGYILPFSYMLYFPIVALEGKLSVSIVLQVLFMQGMWLSTLCFLYRQLWNSGIKRFAAVGQ